jgi:hypothetical protein
MKLFKDGELDTYKEIAATEYVYALMYSWGRKEYGCRSKEYLEEERKELSKIH